MGWGDVTVLKSDLAEGGTTSAVTLNPGEKAHVQVDRTDAGTTDAYIIGVLGSIDGTAGLDSLALIEFRIGATDGPFSFLVGGVYSFAITMSAEGSTDTVTVDVEYRKDGVSL